MGKKIELTEQDVNHMIRLYELGNTHKRIGEIMGFSGIKVGRVLKEQGVPAKTNSDYITIFNKEQEDEIIQKYSSGNSMVDIAKEYGCSKKAISNVLKRRNVSRRTPSEAYRTYTINDYYFDEIDNQDKAYILGFFYADGHNCSNFDNHHYDIGITLHIDDKYILDEICKRMGMNREASIIINSTNKKPYARISITNKHMVYRLDELGVVPNKSRKTKFPVWMREDLYPHFIRGLLDGDGCIPKRLDRVSFCGSHQLMNDLVYVIYNHFGFMPSVGNFKQSNGISYIQICGIQKRLAVLDWIYKDADMKLKRKYDLYLQMKEMYMKAS